MKKTENQLDYEYCGALKEHCRDFVKMKRAVGYKYNAEAALLKQFDTFTQDFTIQEDCLPKKLVLAWSEKRPHESDKTHRSRVHVVNMLAGFMKKMDMTHTSTRFYQAKALDPINSSRTFIPMMSFPGSSKLLTA